MRNTLVVTILIGVAGVAKSEPVRVVVPGHVGEIIAAMRTSTEPVKVSILGRALARKAPRTEKELWDLVDAMKTPSIEPYAQMAISIATEPALGAALSNVLKGLSAHLRHMTPDELKGGPSPRWRAVEGNAANAAAVIHALGAMKYRPAAPELRALLSYDDNLNAAVAYEASQALAAMGDTQGFSMVMDKLGQHKALALSGYGPKAIRAILEKIDAIDATTKTDPMRWGDPRNGQINSLALELSHIRSRDPEVKQTLQALLTHKYQRVQWEASVALSQSLAPQDKNISMEMLHHKDPFVRQRGLDSLRLSKTWDGSFLPVLLDLLQHDPNQDVRAAAARTLAMLPPGVPRQELQSAVPALQAALKDRSNHVRFAAFDALRIITGKFFPYDGMSDAQKVQMQREPPNLY